MTVLKERAELFKKLFNIQYRIILGRKGKETEIFLNFRKNQFFHLCGLHKLTDIQYPTKNKDKIFDLILEDKLSYDMLKKSKLFLPNEDKKLLGIKDRIECIIKIEEILDSNHLIFKYNKNGLRWSDITFEFIFESVDYEIPMYIFIDNVEKNEMGCISMFPKSYTNYTKSQTKMTLLYKEKINLKTGESIVQLNKLKNDNKFGIKIKDIDEAAMDSFLK